MCASMPMKCIAQMPPPIAMAPIASQLKRSPASLSSAIRVANLRKA